MIQKLEVSFLDDVLAVVDVALCLGLLKLNLSHFFSSIHALNLPCNRFFNALFGLKSVDKREKNYCASLESSGCKLIGL